MGSEEYETIRQLMLELERKARNVSFSDASRAMRICTNYPHLTGTERTEVLEWLVGLLDQVREDVEYERETGKKRLRHEDGRTRISHIAAVPVLGHLLNVWHELDEPQKKRVKAFYKIFRKTSLNEWRKNAKRVAKEKKRGKDGKKHKTF